MKEHTRQSIKLVLKDWTGDFMIYGVPFRIMKSKLAAGTGIQLNIVGWAELTEGVVRDSLFHTKLLY